MRRTVLLLLLYLLPTWFQVSWAQPCASEVEPNDDSATAQAIAGCVAGQLDVGNQDWFHFTVNTSDARRFVLLSLGGIVGRGIQAELLRVDAAGSPPRWLFSLETAGGNSASQPILLAPGSYLVSVTAPEGGAYALSIGFGDTLPPTHDVEPNDTQQTVTAIEAAFDLSGEVALDGDWFAWTLPPEAASDSRWQLTVQTPVGSTVDVALVDSTGVFLANAQPDPYGRAELFDLDLAAGTYFLSLKARTPEPSIYRLSAAAAEVPVEGYETEPNNTVERAQAWGVNELRYGRLGTPLDIDQFSIAVDEALAAQKWEIRLESNSRQERSLCLRFTDSAIPGHCRNGRGIVTLADLALPAGQYFVTVDGLPDQDERYTLMSRVTGVLEPDVEREPNDTYVLAAPVDETLHVRGRFDGDESDVYHLMVTGAPQLWRIQVIGDGLTRLSYINPAGEREQLINANGQRRVRLTNLYLLAGSHFFEVWGVSGAYRLVAVPLGPPPPGLERESNDRAGQADRLRFGEPRLGLLTEPDDLDIYRFSLAAEEHIRLIVTPPADGAIRSNIVWGALPVGGQSLPVPGEPFIYEAVLSPGEYHVLLASDLISDSPYSILLTRQNPFTSVIDSAADDDELAVDLELSLDVAAIAAYWHTGQVVDGLLRIANRGNAPLDLTFDSHTSHYKLVLTLPQSRLTLESGASANLPLQVIVADDLPLGDYALSLRARSATGEQVTTTVSLSAVNTEPVSPQRVWAVPDSMLGGLNVAALSQGAVILTSDPAIQTFQPALHDGSTSLEAGFRAPASQLPLTLTIQLAGNEPVPVAGVLLNPQSAGEPSHKLKDFELWLSSDGQAYTLALTGRLSPLPVEQTFPLTEPMLARFAQLRLLSNYASVAGSFVELGEWKVVAVPGTTTVDRFDLADPNNGGHVVHNRPQHSQATEVAKILRADQQTYQVDLTQSTEAEWVLGFHHERAALIEEIEWIEAPAIVSAAPFSQVTVWASVASPVGPWTMLGEFAITPGTTQIAFSEPVWARYLRFVVPAPSQQALAAAPDAIRVWEQPGDERYRTVVGEWGYYSRSGVYEWLHGPAAPPTQAGSDPNDEREQAEPLESGGQVHEQVQIGEDVDWYRIDVPPDQNSVIVHLRGDPTVTVQARFEDDDGRPLPVMIDRLASGEQVMTVMADPASTVYFRVEDPPRSVMFVWDTSASVIRYYDTIYNTLSTYVEGVTPGREVANFLPFGGEPLLPEWSEQPAALQQALNDYDRSDFSSSAEEGLLAATLALADREGTKAVVILTDAASSSYQLTADLWSALAAVQPRIFSVHIVMPSDPLEKPASEQDLMQSWASVNGGYYDFLRSDADLEIAFERAAAWLRRPADYAFTVEVAHVEPPGPGTLQVLSSSTGEANGSRGEALPGNTAVEIILDASWSMMEPLGGRLRMDVAREALLDLTNNVLPEGTPFALRVFGNREGDFACRTDLEMPLQPLNRASVQAVVLGLMPQVDANTAIAQSLLLLRDDLSAAPGRKLVILLTDGEETCGGDPGAAIAALQQAGIDAHVNIIGLGITDPALKTQFERWAQQGDGRYFDASSAEALSASLSAVLSAPYRILDVEDIAIAEGFVDGAPISVPAGVYTVEVLTDPIITMEDVLIGGEEDVVIRLQR